MLTAARRCTSSITGFSHGEWYVPAAKISLRSLRDTMSMLMLSAMSLSGRGGLAVNAFAPGEAELLGVERHEEHRVTQRVSLDVARNREQGGHARRVVIRARVGPAVLDAEVIVVRRDDNRPGCGGRPFTAPTRLAAAYSVRPRRFERVNWNG